MNTLERLKAAFGLADDTNDDTDESDDETDTNEGGSRYA